MAQAPPSLTLSTAADPLDEGEAVNEMQATVSPALSSSPVRVEGHFEQPSRTRWLIKVSSFTNRSRFTSASGGAPPSRPAAQRFWAATTTGSGSRTLAWQPQPGNWRIVLMNADGARGVSGDVSVGARLPQLLTIATAILGAGLLLILLSGTALYLAITRR